MWNSTYELSSMFSQYLCQSLYYHGKKIKEIRLMAQLRNEMWQLTNEHTCKCSTARTIYNSIALSYIRKWKLMRSFVYKILLIRRIGVCVDADSLRNAKKMKMQSTRKRNTKYLYGISVWFQGGCCYYIKLSTNE